MLKNSNFKDKIVISFSVIITLIGIILVSYNYFQSKVLKAYNEMNLHILALNDSEEILNIEEFLNSRDENIVEENTIDENLDENIEEVDEEEKIEEVVVDNKPQVSKPKIEYIASLSIPKISLKHGLTSINSKYNSVNYGIQIIKGSDFPDVVNGNLILASHSGTSYRSLFKNLYMVNIGDICIVSYKGKEYKYEITNIYNKPKIGKITIERDYKKNTLTLITCTKNSDTEQTIYIGELVQE